MRISDWSSDVCSSDLASNKFAGAGKLVAGIKRGGAEAHTGSQRLQKHARHHQAAGIEHRGIAKVDRAGIRPMLFAQRLDTRADIAECVLPCGRIELAARFTRSEEHKSALK